MQHNGANIVADVKVVLTATANMMSVAFPIFRDLSLETV